MLLLLLTARLAHATDLAAMIGAMPDCQSQVAAMAALAETAEPDLRSRLEIALLVMEQLGENGRFETGACGRCAVAAVSDDPDLRAAAAAAARRGLACPSVTATPDQQPAIDRYRAESLHVVDHNVHIAPTSTVILAGGTTPMYIPLTTTGVDIATFKVVTGEGQDQRPLETAIVLGDVEAQQVIRRRRTRAVGVGVGGVVLGTGAFLWSLDTLTNGDSAGAGVVLLLAASGLYTVGIGVPATAAGKNKGYSPNWDRMALADQIDEHNRSLRAELGLDPDDVADIDELVDRWDPAQ